MCQFSMAQHLTNAMWLLTWAAVITTGPAAASTTGASSEAYGLNRLLRDNLVIECQRIGIRVSFRRPALEEAGIQVQWLSFYDLSCRASNNGTHFVLTTTFAECGGIVSKEQGRAYNRIQLVDGGGGGRPAARRRGRGVGGPSEDDDDESSGSGDRPPSQVPAARLPAAGPAAAAANPLWSLPFVCEYSNRTQLPSAGSQRTVATAPAARWRLNMSISFFPSDAYVAPLKHYPLRVYAGDELYVQVSPEGAGSEHSALRAVVSSCFLSSAAGEGGSKRVTLVDRGCALDGTLTWHGEDELASHRRFSFRASRQFPSFSFLHCSVDVCSLRPPPASSEATTAAGAAAGPKLCSSQAQLCSQQRTAQLPAEAQQGEPAGVHSGALVIQGRREQPAAGYHQPPQPRDHQPAQPHPDASSLSSSSTVLPAAHQPGSPAPAGAVADARTATAAPAATIAGGGPALPSPQAPLPLPGSAAGLALDRTSAPSSPLGGSSPASGLAIGAVIGIAVGAFVVGCVTVGALWIIHTCTDPRRRLLSVPTTEDSGSQTSRSPMSV